MTQSIAAQTFESDGLKYTILDDKEWTVSLAGAVDANITNLDIPSTVPYYPGGNVAGKIDCTVVEIGTRAFYQCSSLTAVRMASSVLNIGDRAFESCTSLKSITLSDNITYIGDSAFSFCNTLESIVMPTGLKGIGAYAFQYCQAQCDVTLNEGLESIGGDAFSNNDAMREIEFPSTPFLCTEIDAKQKFEQISSLSEILVVPSRYNIKRNLLCHERSGIIPYPGR